MSVAVISKTGERLMPTSEYRARKLKHSYHPFLMPMTGSDGTWMYGFVGFVAIAFTGCLYLLLDEKKKNKRKHRRKRK